MGTIIVPLRKTFYMYFMDYDGTSFGIFLFLYHRNMTTNER